MTSEGRQQTELKEFLIEGRSNTIIHQFSDLHNIPCVFDLRSERIFFTEFTKGNNKPIIYDGYLARKNDYGNVQYFHRFLFNKLKIKDKQVHHINMNKTDNRFENLKIMDGKKHEIHHSNRRYWKAFETWSYKTGNDNEDAFNEWLIEKGEDDQEDDDEDY